MKITEITSNDYENLDSADTWLSKYTLESLDKWPSREVWQTLIKRYPADTGQKIYRGMHFYTKEEWDSFIDEYNSSNGQLDFRGISSWTRSPGTATQFAITRPTYFLNHEVMQAHDKMHREREHMTGYRGVILETIIHKNNQAVDVAKSDFSKEDEVILAPGKHQVKINRIVKRFEHIMTDQDETIRSVLEKYLDIRSTGKRDEYYRKFYDYVMHHYPGDIKSNEELKEMVYQISVAYLKSHSSLEDTVSVKIESTDDFFGTRSGFTEVRVSFNPGLFILASNGFFPDDKTGILQSYANRIVQAYLETMESHSGYGYIYNFKNLDVLTDYLSDPSIIRKIQTKQVRDAYDYVNSREMNRKLSGISDPNERRLAFEKHIAQIKDIIGQLSR